MKFNIKALLVTAALILGMQQSAFAMQSNQMPKPGAGISLDAVPALVVKGGVWAPGKFYAFGYVNQAGQKVAAVARLNAVNADTMVLDPSFGDNGLVIARGAPNSEAFELLFTSDGMYVRLRTPGARPPYPRWALHLSPAGVQK